VPLRIVVMSVSVTGDTVMGITLEVLLVPCCSLTVGSGGVRHNCEGEDVYFGDEQ